MLTLFFFSIICSSTNPNCILNVGGNLIDLSNINIANQNFYYSDSAWGEFAFRLCGDLTKDGSKVPSCGTDNVGWAGASIGKDGKCYPVAATDSLKISKVSDAKFHVEYGSDTDSEPGSVDEVHTIHEFSCVHQQTTDTPTVTVNDEGTNRYITLKYNIECKVLPNTPTPSPTPACDPIFTKASTTQPGLGIQFSLAEFEKFDMGPTFYEEGNLEVHFTPGSFQQCPLPYNCYHYTPSSLFMCRAGKIKNRINGSLQTFSEKTGYCTSYGVASHALKFDQQGIAEGDGVYARYTSNDIGKTANVFFQCDKTAPPHILKQVSKFKGDANTIELKVNTSDSCIRTVTPVPDPLHRYCVHKSDLDNHPISFDLRDYNVANGIQSSVTLKDTSTGQKTAATFYIQPCGEIGCPANHICGSTTTSSFWTCSGNSCESVADITTGDLNFVRDNNQYVSAIFGSSLYGFKNATIMLTCDRKANELYIEDNATVDEYKKYTVRILGKQFCTREDKKTSGGAIFLIVLASLIFAYLLFGILIMSLLRSKFTFPNSSFWLEFGRCVRDAAVFIFTCGKRENGLIQSTYDKV